MPRVIDGDELDNYSTVYKGNLISNYPYNRCCPVCCVRWTSGEAPRYGMEGVEIELERCGKPACRDATLIDLERQRQKRRDRYAYVKLEDR